jgi:hypothetical protein
MKSKTLLLLLGSYLSVTSVWGAGYNVNLARGVLNLFGNQLTLSPNDLANTQLGLMLNNGSVVYTWDVPTQNFVPHTKSLGGWSSDPPLSAGEGFYCKPSGSGGSLVIPFNGTASSTPTPIPSFSPATLWYLLGSQTYDSTPGATYNFYDITGYTTPPTAGVSLYRLASAVPGGSPVPSLPPTDPTAWNEYWYDGVSWHPSDPQIYLGEAVWIGPSQCSILGTVVDYLGSPLPNWEMSLSDGQYTFTDANGKYHFAVSSGGEYTVYQVPFCGWDTLSQPISLTVNCPGTTIAPQSVAIPQPGGTNHGPDLYVVIMYNPDPGNPFFPCPNDTGSYLVYYQNKCGATVPAGSTLQVVLSGNVIYGTYSTPGSPSWTETPPVGGSPASGFLDLGSTLTWTLGPLPTGSVGLIRIPIQVSGTVATSPPYTTVTTTATLFPVVGDAYPADNLAQENRRAKCAFDPNDKTVEPAGCGPSGLINNQLLTYTVRFQNVGAAPAFKVVVSDQLDPSLNPSTLKILGASANYVFNLSGNQMTWTFPNINLPYAAADLPGSCGFVRYQAQPFPSLPDGTVITNQASIVFDKNPPILTETTTNTITSATLASASFAVAPRIGSAGHTNDFIYTGGTAGATFYWDFGPDAIPPTSTDMNPSGVVFPTDGLRTMNLQVSSGDCTTDPAAHLLNVGRPILNIASSGSNHFVLSWQGDGYKLQQSSTLSSPVPWQSINPPLTQIGATYFTPAIAISNITTFFRLTDQP